MNNIEGTINVVYREVYRVRGVEESVTNIEGLSMLFTEKCIVSEIDQVTNTR